MWNVPLGGILTHFLMGLDVHRTHTPRCEVKKIIALWRMHAVMQGWKEVGCED